MNIKTLLLLIPALPLLAAVVTAVLGPRVLREKSHWPTILAVATSFCLSLVLFAEVRYQAATSTQAVGWEKPVELWHWADIEGAYETESRTYDFLVPVTLRADALTSMMLTMVTFVSMLIAIYSSGYMHDDRGYWRFFSYISLFVFSMTMLVSVSNFLLLYVFWEAVGVCSYLLIGFWYEKPAAAAAGKKAFLVNRVGDFGFALGLFLLWTTYGTLNFHDTTTAAGESLPGVLGQVMLEHPELYVGGAVGLGICLLLLVGACGKSAQFPLHVWLPDAMEGPTPVSALIHAATMVTAGVYMIARCTPLFMVSETAQMVVASIGGFTALLAALIAITRTDLKQVLAYSTISQLGFMFLALGTATLASVVGGMFHLFTHAFFKALLFLGAGSVMHAMGGVIDMRSFGGLRRLMPVTHWTFLFGCLALAGVYPFSGFWSKDAILHGLHAKGHDGELYLYLYYAAKFTAVLTALYTFRAFFLTFYGQERFPSEAGHHAHESPPSMTWPLTLLAVCAIFAGFLHPAFAQFLSTTPSLAYSTITATGSAYEPLDTQAIVAATALALAGIAVAAFFYLGGRRQAEWLASIFRPLYQLSYRKFFFDELYTLLVVWPSLGLAKLFYWLDRYVVDGLVHLCAKIPLTIGTWARALQTGLVQFYAMLMVLGLLVLIGLVVFANHG